MVSPEGQEPSSLSIVTWNLGGARRSSRYRKLQPRSLRYLTEELAPDLALVQEVAFPVLDSLALPVDVVRVPAMEGGDWGSAIVAPRGALRALHFVSFGSYVAAAELDFRGTLLVVVSVHVCPDRKQAKYLATLAKTLRDAIAGRNCIIGGDFNAARRYDVVHRRRFYRPFFEAMTASGFHDAHFGLHGKEVQSYWRAPYQDDHLFVGAHQRHLVRACEVVDDVAVRSLSDHGPVRLTLLGEDQ